MHTVGRCTLLRRRKAGVSLIVLVLLTAVTVLAVCRHFIRISTILDTSVRVHETPTYSRLNLHVDVPTTSMSNDVIREHKTDGYAVNDMVQKRNRVTAQDFASDKLAVPVSSSAFVFGRQWADSIKRLPTIRTTSFLHHLKEEKKARIRNVKTNDYAIVVRLPPQVRIFNAMSEPLSKRQLVAKSRCVVLKTYFGDAPICVHDPKVDHIISAYIVDKGKWEPNLVYVVSKIVARNSNMTFLDLGCNVGVYTLMAAKMNRRVIAVDPNKQNLRLLTKSLSFNNILNRVTLLWNAISNIHGTAVLNEVSGNVGGSYIEPLNNDTADTIYEPVQTIVLDDIIDMFNDKKVFIKMDIESYEWKALEGGYNFFEKMDVAYVVMEWIFHRKHDSGIQIIEFMTRFGLHAHVNDHAATKLDVDNYRDWPENVLWIKSYVHNRPR